MRNDPPSRLSLLPCVDVFELILGLVVVEVVESTDPVLVVDIFLHLLEVVLGGMCVGIVDAGEGGVDLFEHKLEIHASGAFLSIAGEEQN